MRRFITIPWIAQKGDLLTDAVAQQGLVEIVPLPLYDQKRNSERHALNIIAARFPDRFAAFFETALLRIRLPCHGLLLTHDWPPAMRVAAQVARAHGLPVFLAAHEAFFAVQDLYYCDPRSGANCPEADLTFVWGHLQQEIFAARGYPIERLRVIGSVKLAASLSKPDLDFAAMRRLIGAPEDRPLVCYVGQHMDNLRDKDAGRRRQIEAVNETARLCLEKGWSLTLRLPPALDPAVLERPLLERWGGKPPFALISPEKGPGLWANPLAHVAASDLVMGYCSTMLLEAALMRRPTMIYAAGLPETLWEERLRLPVARAPDRLAETAEKTLDQTDAGLGEEARRWIAWALSDGTLAPSDVVGRLREGLIAAAGPPIFPYGRAPLFKRGFFPALDPGVMRWALRLAAWRIERVRDGRARKAR